jgi:hypothetical protein
MNKPRTGERAGMASDAALHSRCGQDLHGVISYAVSLIREIAYFFTFD